MAKNNAGESREKVAEARTDLTYVAHGASILLAAVAVLALNYRLLSVAGAQGVDPRADILITVLAVAGGSKGVHELVGRLQKAKEAAETKSA